MICGSHRRFASWALGFCLAVSSFAAAAATTGVVASGLGGNEHYADEFDAQAESVTSALRSLSADGAAMTRIDGATSGREPLLEAIRRQGAAAEDVFVLVLLGHGSVDSATWRFNITGPDITTDDLVGALAEVQARQQIIIVSTSASGALLEVLTQPGRVVVTATKSAGEINAVRFSGYLADAMTDGKADVDRNEILTVAEVFRHANAATGNYFESENLLASEHARLAGDEAASLALAHLGSLQRARNDPAVTALLDTRLELEAEFRALRQRKDDMGTTRYYDELETLLLAIARLQQAIDRATGWSDSDA